MAGVKLKWLKIEKYRNVAPGTELHFSDRFNVLLGKNGTGKTTLLKLIAMIVRGSFVDLAKLPFEFSYELAFPGLDVEVQLKSEKRALDRAPDGFYQEWSYDVSFQFLNQPCSYRIRASAGSPTKLERAGHDNVSQQLPSHVWVSPFEERFFRGLLTQLNFEDQPPFAGAEDAMTAMSPGRGGRFDEGLGGFAAMTEISSEEANGDFRAGHVTIRANSSGKPLSWALSSAPHEILFAIGSAGPNETIAVGHTKLDFLKKTASAMGLRDAELLMRRRRKVVDQSNGDQTATYAGFEFNFTLQDGEVIRHEDLSYGQKRLLSFFYYAACNPDIIIADELVNGLHHDWAQLCLDEIVERQSFLASQDPLLFDFLFFESEDEVRQSFIPCSLEQRDGRGQFVWKNLDIESAASFYRAYKAGIQHVSEILYTKGLW